MGKAEIIAALPRLSPEDLAEVRAKLNELTDLSWDRGADLSDNDKQALDAALAEYERAPDAGSSWDDVKARLLAQRIK